MSKNTDNIKNDKLFEIYDFAYINQAAFFLIGGLIGLLLTIISPEQSFDEAFLRLFSIAGIFAGIFGLSMFYKNKDLKIHFHEDKLYQDRKLITVDLENVTEVHKISYFFYFLKRNKIHRQGSISKFILCLCSPIFFFLLYAPTILFTLIYYKKLYIRNLILIVGKNDKEHIFIETPLLNQDDDLKLTSYLKERLDIDVNSLEPKWFIPEKPRELRRREWEEEQRRLASK